MFSRKILGLSLLVVLALCVSLKAQVPAQFNATVEHLSVQVQPPPAGGAGTPLVDVLTGFSISVEGDIRAEEIPLVADILVNSVPVSSQTFNIIAMGGTASGCATNCAESDKVCVCLEGTSFCGCGTLVWLGGPVPVPLRPEDEIMVILRPVPGALPETDPNDNQKMIVFGGESTAPFWNRRISSVEIQPSSGPSGNGFEFHGEFAIDVEPSSIPLDLSTEVEVQVNGVPVHTQEFAIGTDPGCGSCEEDEACICLLGTGECFCATILIPLDPIPVEPLDVVKVILRPVPGALPELPGFPDDEEEEPVPEPERPFRRADANIDGSVNIADPQYTVNWLFLNGPAIECMDAADANDDGAVNIADPSYTVNYIFLNGPVPPDPGPNNCGVDPTKDPLDCQSYRECEPAV